MEAKELRIGNLISASTDVDDKPEFCEVRQLKNRGLVWRSTGSTDDEGGNYTSYEFSEPIPLTPELLEKAGFTKIKDGFMSPDIYERKYTPPGPRRYMTIGGILVIVTALPPNISAIYHHPPNQRYGCEKAKRSYWTRISTIAV